MQVSGRRGRPILLGIFQLYAVTGWSSGRWLKRLVCPTFVIGGDDDPSVPVHNARVLAARIPNARLHVVNGGEHLFLLDEPENVAGGDAVPADTSPAGGPTTTDGSRRVPAS